MPETRLTRAKVLRLAVPVMLAQAATAMTSVVDTAVMGLHGDKTDLGAVAIASVVMSFIYWGFGFLRMSTTGLTAQAAGAGDEEDVRANLQRALLIGGALGLILIALSPLLRISVFAPFAATEDVKTLALSYFDARIWGAPAVLMGYAVTGWLLGTGRTGQLLAFQIVLNGVNAGLDIWFVAGLGWGPAGIGAGTAIAEWVSLAFAAILVFRSLSPAESLFDRQKLIGLFGANRDILIRTLALLFSFAWFANAGATMGTAQLAGNEVLLQFISVSAFVLDGFAFVAEKEVGEAFGRGEAKRLKRAMRVTSELALCFALLISLGYFLLGGPLIRSFVSDAEARAAALAYLPYCALVPVIGLPAWLLDGFFLGATRGRALRNAAIIATTGYVLVDLALRPPFGSTGLWSAFLCMYVLRAGTLAWHLPSLFADLKRDPRPQPR